MNASRFFEEYRILPSQLGRSALRKAAQNVVVQNPEQP